jgi:hypothetical protein
MSVQVGVVITLQTYIQGMVSSNLGCDTGYPD